MFWKHLDFNVIYLCIVSRHECHNRLHSLSLFYSLVLIYGPMRVNLLNFSLELNGFPFVASKVWNFVVSSEFKAFFFVSQLITLCVLRRRFLFISFKTNSTKFNLKVEINKLRLNWALLYDFAIFVAVVDNNIRFYYNFYFVENII